MKNSLYKPILAMLILFSIVILPLISANTFAYNYLELKEPSGNITNEYINNTYINQTLELNSTQFETGEPATIKTSWLTSFIESISKWANYYTKTEIDARYSNNTGDQNLSTYVEGNMSAETYNETTITPTTNYSLSFDGVNDYVSIVDDSSLDLGAINDFSISAWVNLKGYGTSHSTILQKYRASFGNTYYGLRVDGISNPKKMSFTIWDGTYNPMVFDNVNVPLNTWTHFVGIRNATHLQLWRDGVLVNSTTDTTTGTLSNSANLYLGSSGGTRNYFNGSIDEVLIFNRSLSSDEISQLYNSGNGLYANTSIAPFNDGLVAGYHFDEGTGTTAYDITGRNNGTLVNGPTWVDGKISHNLTSTTETLGAIGLMPWVSSTNFISTDYSLQWLNNILLNPWNTISQLGNSTNRFNVFAWNLTADKYFSSDGSQGWTGNCVNASYKNGIVVGCND